MPRPKQTILVLLVIGLAIVASPLPSQDAEQAEREAMYYRYLEFRSLVKGGSIEPHWMADGSSFWYAEGAPENTVIYRVDPQANTQVPLFDTARLRQALAPLLGDEPPYQGLPFEEFTFIGDGEQTVEFTVADRAFILQLDSYVVTPSPAGSQEEKRRLIPQIARSYPYPDAGNELVEVLSPNRRWFATLKDHDIWLRSSADGREVQLSADGTADYQWGSREWSPRSWASWSPDSSKLAARKVDLRQVPKSPIVHWLAPKEEVEWVHLSWDRWAGGPMRQTELFVIDIPAGRQVRVDVGEEPDQALNLLGWRPDGSEVLFLRSTRDKKTMDLMAADPQTGASRVVVRERQETFVAGGWDEWDGGGHVHFLEDGQRVLWLSERDGWKHLFLYDLEGHLLRRLTEGAWPMLQIIAVDEEAGWVYFTAHADPQRPYDTHLYRVSLQGGPFTQLTEGSGQHAVQIAPSKGFFLDTHSSVERAPVVELRQVDGTLVRTLSEAKIDALRRKLQWSPPEEFVVKAADGKTDLWGVLYKPYDFDPNRKYPVIEFADPNPTWTTVQRHFSPGAGWPGRMQSWRLLPQALAQLGFITFAVDGRGTPERGKAFQDLIYWDRGHQEIPDHAATLKQLAEERPYMDLDRVGIYGAAGGGYTAIRALLVAPDVYHAAAALNPEVDLSEQFHEWYMGLPQENPEGWRDVSNTRLASNLEGKLLLIHRTSSSVGVSNTMKMVAALIQANKPFDLIVQPEEGIIPTRYRREAVRRYFEEHLKP